MRPVVQRGLDRLVNELTPSPTSKEALYNACAVLSAHPELFQPVSFLGITTGHRFSFVKKRCQEEMLVNPYPDLDFRLNDTLSMSAEDRVCIYRDAFRKAELFELLPPAASK